LSLGLTGAQATAWASARSHTAAAQTASASASAQTTASAAAQTAARVPAQTSTYPSPSACAAISAGRICRSRAGGDLIGGRLEVACATANEQITEQFGDLAAVAVTDPVNLDSGARHRRIVEAIDPFRGGAQQFGLARRHEDGIRAGDGLQLDQMLAEAIFPESKIFSSSVIKGSGVELWTGKIPTDWPRIQSSSKLRMVSTAVRRSSPLPITNIRFFVGSALIAPGFVAKLSKSFEIVCTETC